MEDINNYITSIIRVAHNNLPVEDGWTEFEIEAYCLTKFVQYHATYTDESGKQISYDPKEPSAADRSEDLTFLFMDLRKAMYDTTPGQGAWYTCKIVVKSDGKFNTYFDYDNKPPFKYTPSNDKFAHDLQTYPRETVPAWLTEIVG